MSKKPKKLSTEQISTIKELHAKGMSSYAVAKQMGIPAGVARYHVARSTVSKVAPSKDKIVVSPDCLAIYLHEIQSLKQKNKVLFELLTEQLRA